MADLDLYRQAYERGRRDLGTRYAPAGLLAGLLLLTAGATLQHAVLLGGALAVVVAVAGWARTAALHGALLGLGALVVPLTGNGFMALTHDALPMATCTQICAGISIAGGIAIGLLAGHNAARSVEAGPYLLGTLATAGLAGLAGCAAVGLGNALGLGLGLTLAMVPGYAVGARLAGARTL